MPPFRRVESQQAGPRALGILVPHGARTLVILRPRSLPWDLLPARWNGAPEAAPSFCTFTRDDAARAARRVQQALELAVLAGTCPIQTAGAANDTAHQVWLRTDEHVWILCHRAPGQPYRPALFTERDDALRHAEQITPIFWPAADAEQEYYFNTQHFA